FSQRVEAVYRDDVSGENRAVGPDVAVRPRIINDVRDLAEVAVLHPGRRNRPEACAQSTAAEALVVGKEEGAIPHDRTADGAAELVHLERGLACFEETSRIYRRVAQIFEQGTMEHVGTTLDGCVDHAARSSSELGRKRVGLDLELLDRIDRGTDNERRAVQKVDHVDVVVDAVEQIVILT